MELDTVIIGNRIKERRKDLHLTQTDIKEKTGISSGNMSDIERGNRLPAATTLAQLAEVLQCSIDYIVNGKTPTSEIPISSQCEEISKSDHALLEYFHGMLIEDQDELLSIAKMKYDRAKKNAAGRAISSASDPKDRTSEIA